jgi:prepilin-type N-terminal cleavage/methylation domain-containing protein
MKNGFSLVELSIVLVILGLLTGGILAGQSLLRASELRAVTTDYQRYVTASNSFRDKYFALAGDMNTATKFWGDDNAACADATIPNGTPGTCNGNGDGLLAFGAGANATGENFRFWQQLALAGLIQGTYTGLAGAGNERGTTPGVNAPAGRISSSGYSLETVGTGILGAGDTWRWPGNYRNNIYFGAIFDSSHPAEYPILKPEEAWNIETKIDDGKPAYGAVRSYRPVVPWPNCVTTNVESTTEYNLTNTSITCALLFPQSVN